ncbi:hypothetical protein ACFZC6_42430 [Streptomyces ossamyceticus]|uniref:hypothetical protein n=1 Tax=Streptomyces ossamyceticus TaxID=249581 RepID=UPI0036EAD4C9
MTAKNIQPIETRYKGYRFRSRLEARWAVFMDHLGLAWDYESQGYLVDGKPYLPDFLVRPDDKEGAFWLEIKGSFPTEEERLKVRGLAEGTGIRAFLYSGKLESPAPDLSHLDMTRYVGPHERDYAWTDDHGWDKSADRSVDWEVGLTPTAFLFGPRRARDDKSDFLWWAECTACGYVKISRAGQRAWCPKFDDLSLEELERRFGPLYPCFGHRTPRILAAYEAARSARFEHGESGA